MIVKEKPRVIKRPGKFFGSYYIDWDWLFAHCTLIFVLIFGVGVLWFIVWMSL